MYVYSLREGPGVSCSGSMIRLVGRLISLFVDGLIGLFVDELIGL